MNTDNKSQLASATVSSRKPASIPKTRWAAYATASAATALTVSSAEAVIHYSGRLDLHFHEGDRTFSLDQPGDSCRLFNFINSYHEGLVLFYVSGIASAAFRGFPVGGSLYASKLSAGQNISAGSFTQNAPGRRGGILIGDYFGEGSQYGQWRRPGPGFIGFRFNSGAGVQYGWVRIKMPRHFHKSVPLELIDYAYADPGEPITAGQTSSSEQAPGQGSLGWLALGAGGLLAWRKSRSRAAR